MGEIINRTTASAMAWQQGAVWMRINAAYIQAELPHLVSRGQDIAEIEPLLAKFAPVFLKFCEEEYKVFLLARQAEVDAAERKHLLTHLSILRESFRPWVEEYHALVQKMNAQDPQSLGLVLLMSCGAEIHQGQDTFITAIDNHLEGLRPKEA